MINFIPDQFASEARSAENPFGREDAHDYIKHANMIACRVCLLWLLATVRHTYFFIEQPSSSRLVILPYIEFVVKTLSRYMSVFRTFLYLGLYILLLLISLGNPKYFVYSTLCWANQRWHHLSWMGSYGHFSCKGSLALGTTNLS